MDLSFLKPNFTFDKTVRVVLTGGGSGGHTFPLIAVYRELKKMSAEKKFLLDVTYIGPDDFTTPFMLKEEGIKIRTISSGKIRGSWNVVKTIWRFLQWVWGIVQAGYYLYVIMPDVIFSKGGYGSFPAVFWGIIFFIPTYAHESDAVPGLVNSLMGRFCRRVFISFDYTKRYFAPQKTILTGNPVRLELFDTSLGAENAKKALGLDLERPVVTVIGGSQGSQHINDFILDILPKIVKYAEIIHQTGKNNYQNVIRESEVVFQEIIEDQSQKKYYHPVAFFEESAATGPFSMPDVLAASDLIIARAGSGLIFEIAVSGKPSILIPLPWASRGHQKKNAYEYSEKGAAVVIEEGNLKPNIFSDLIVRILSEDSTREKMSKAALSFAKREAAAQIARYLLEQV